MLNKLKKKIEEYIRLKNSIEGESSKSILVKFWLCILLFFAVLCLLFDYKEQILSCDLSKRSCDVERITNIGTRENIHNIVDPYQIKDIYVQKQYHSGRHNFLYKYDICFRVIEGRDKCIFLDIYRKNKAKNTEKELRTLFGNNNKNIIKYKFK